MTGICNNIQAHVNYVSYDPALPLSQALSIFHQDATYCI